MKHMPLLYEEKQFSRQTRVLIHNAEGGRDSAVDCPI